MAKTDPAVIIARRELISYLLLRAYSQRQIARLMEKIAIGSNIDYLKYRDVCTNPKTGNVWSLGTINADCKAIFNEWRKNTDQNYDDKVAHEAAKLNEMESELWKQAGAMSQKVNLLLSIQQRRASLLGLDAMTRHRIEHDKQMMVPISEGLAAILEKLGRSAEDALALIETILRKKLEVEHG